MEPARRRVVKKVDGGHAHHGGAWKVAYADFVTAMMALFMVMWLLASTDAASRKEISNYFRTGILPDGDLAQNHAAQVAPSVMEVAPVPPPPDKATLEADTGSLKSQLNERLYKLAAADKELADVIKDVKLEVTPEGIRIDMVDAGHDLLFDTASAKLKEPLERFLRAVSPLIASMHAPIEISGHTDARPFLAGSTMSNWDLSYARAASARDIFENNGVPATQIAGVFARAASQPFVPADPLAPQNRRLSVFIHVVKATDSL
jgi:chemotaxis protein MotB